MIGQNLYRPYKNNKPVTTKWYETHEQAKDWGKCFAGDNVEIRKKDINLLLSRRIKTGFRGLL